MRTLFGSDYRPAEGLRMSKDFPNEVSGLDDAVVKAVMSDALRELLEGVLN